MLILKRIFFCIFFSFFILIFYYRTVLAHKLFQKENIQNISFRHWNSFCGWIFLFDECIHSLSLFTFFSFPSLFSVHSHHILFIIHCHYHHHRHHHHHNTLSSSLFFSLFFVSLFFFLSSSPLFFSLFFVSLFFFLSSLLSSSHHPPRCGCGGWSPPSGGWGPSWRHRSHSPSCGRYDTHTQNSLYSNTSYIPTFAFGYFFVCPIN